MMLCPPFKHIDVEKGLALSRHSNSPQKCFQSGWGGAEFMDKNEEPISKALSH